MRAVATCFGPVSGASRAERSRRRLRARHASGLMANNSNRNPSYYAGGGALHRFKFDGVHVDAGAVGFVMIREDYNDDRPFLGVLPAFSLGTKNIAVNFTYIPKIEPKSVPLWFFQLKINLTNLF
jgi:hypothetical protein